MSQFFCHFSFTTTFRDKILYETNIFLQTEVKFELQINFQNDILIVNRIDDECKYHRMIFVGIYLFNAGW